MLKKLLNVAILFILTFHISMGADKPDSFDRNNNGILSRIFSRNSILENDSNWKKNKNSHDYWEKAHDFWEKKHDYWQKRHDFWENEDISISDISRGDIRSISHKERAIAEKEEAIAYKEEAITYKERAIAYKEIIGSRMKEQEQKLHIVLKESKNIVKEVKYSEINPLSEIPILQQISEQIPSDIPERRLPDEFGMASQFIMKFINVINKETKEEITSITKEWEDKREINAQNYLTFLNNNIIHRPLAFKKYRDKKNIIDNEYNEQINVVGRRLQTYNEILQMMFNENVGIEIMFHIPTFRLN
jgi:hypothetical protein